MVVGCVKEIKIHEYRVGLTPRCVKAYIGAGHYVLIEHNAGVGSGYSDSDYIASGADILDSPQEIYSRSNMVVKVKEPMESEYKYLKDGLILFTFLHLAANINLTKELLLRGVTAIAYETIELHSGILPCLRPMSEIAGKLSIQEGAKYLENNYGGSGILLGGIPGVDKGNVTILGAGIAGLNAAKVAFGLGANVTILDTNIDRLEYIESIFLGKINTLISNRENILKSITGSDIVVGAVLIPGQKPPTLLYKEDLKLLRRGSVLVDIAIDQGGCFETSKPTNHIDPTYIVDGVVHYCVTNMPGVVSRTATDALTSITLGYGLEIAKKDLYRGVRYSSGLLAGLNTYNGELVNSSVATSLDMDFKEDFK